MLPQKFKILVPHVLLGCQK